MSEQEPGVQAASPAGAVLEVHPEPAAIGVLEPSLDDLKASGVSDADARMQLALRNGWVRMVKGGKDYSAGSLTEFIRRAESAEELNELRKLAVSLLQAGKVKRRTARLWDQAGAAKAKELAERKIIRPNPPGAILVPEPKVAPVGRLIVEP